MPVACWCGGRAVRCDVGWLPRLGLSRGSGVVLSGAASPTAEAGGQAGGHGAGREGMVSRDTVQAGGAQGRQGCHGVPGYGAGRVPRCR